MNVWISMLVLVVLSGFAIVGARFEVLHPVFGIVIPYASVATFLVGMIYRVVKWAKTPVPFHIITTAGQQKSLAWIKPSRLDCPHTTLGVVGRMALEILLFRSLFRNTKAEVKSGPRLLYSGEKLLWASGLLFHWTFLIVLLRHCRFFTTPVPAFFTWLQSLDGFFQVGLPVMYLTDVALLAAVTYLFFRRLLSPSIRYISLAGDYFPLLLIGTITVTGILMRYFFKTDVVAVKELAMGLVIFQPAVPQNLGTLFYLHLFTVSVLFAYFPFSKLVHLGGVFLSPTRNLSNNSRTQRHVNPWDYPVKTHTYEEWEDEFRDKLRAAGMPLEKE